MELAVKAKAKRRHLSTEECGRLGRSPEGTNALTQPNNVTHWSPNYDPNRGLYPRTPTKKPKFGSPDKQQKGIGDFFSVTRVVSTSPQTSAQQSTSSRSRGLDIEATPKKEPDVGEEEEDDDNDDDVSLLAGMAAPLKQEQETFSVTSAVSFRPGGNSAQRASQSRGPDREVTAKKELKMDEEEDDDDDDRSLLVAAIKHEEETDYLEGITAEMWDDDDQFDDGGGDLTWSQENGGQEEWGDEWGEEELDHADVVEALPDDHYGLLGSSRHLAEPQGCADDLPVEVLRKVLSLLPAQDLYRHAVLVCHRWKDVIQDPKFVPLKKRYYRYLMGEKSAMSAIRTILGDSCILLEFYDGQSQSQSVCQLVSLMSQHTPGERVRPEDVQQCVKRHRLFPQAEACIASRFPEIPQNGPNRAYAAMALILVLSETVKDVQALVSHLQGTMTHSAITEFLSEMATFLLAMDRYNIWISNRLHYNIYYVLHLMENAPTPIYTKHGGPQLPVTHEQHQILSHDIRSDHVVKIMAFAGTGKTTTLIRYAEQRPHLRFLYVAFNKSVAKEAQRRFPGNVTCRTMHSMAWGAVGKLYREKSAPNVKVLSINYVLPKGRGGFINGKVVTETLNAYMASADRCINTSHVPPTCRNNKGRMEDLSAEKIKGYVNDAQKIWERMKNPHERSQVGYRMTHDGYLKLWQLQNPCLSDYMSVDVIFIDEAQDCTPAIMDILMSPRCGKILVGDPHQQIYTFRGAVNALHLVEHTHLYYLTQSFRFGAEIAYVGATILRVCKRIKKKILVGGNQPGRFCDESTYPSAAINGSTGVSAAEQGRTAILSRTNVGVFSEAVKLTDANPACRIHFVGGAVIQSLTTILEIWKLMQSGNTGAVKDVPVVHSADPSHGDNGDSKHKDPFIQMFYRPKMGGFSGLKKYAEQTEDRELEAKVTVVEKYSVRIPELVKRLKLCESNTENADFILGTVHKAKGLEFDTVIITDDFAKVPGARHNLGHWPGISWRMIPTDEWNLLYVAVTRAKTNLIVSNSVGHILTQAGEYFLKAETMGSVMPEGNPPPCSVRECENFIMADSAFAMCRRPMRYTDLADAGGPLCERCVWQRIGPTAFLQTQRVFELAETEENPVLPACYARIF